MMDEVLKAEEVLSAYPTYRKWLRFPYLAEGKTPAGRDAMRSLLVKHRYKNAHVTIDASDWYINQRLIRRLKKEPKAELSPYRAYYVNHLWDRANYYNHLAAKLTGRTDIPHTLLLHHNLTAALFLGDALAMFKARGWRLVDVEKAYEDSLFRASPNSLPAGQSLIWAMAKASGRYEGQLRYPGEGKRYEKAGLDRLEAQR